MGRPKKHAASPPGPAKKPPKRPPKKPAATNATLQAALQQQLMEVKLELQRLYLEGAADKIVTSLLVAGLTQRLWGIEALLAENPDVALAMSRQAAAWGEQHVRAAKAMSTDLLRDLFDRAEAMQRHQGQLKELK